MSEHLSPPRPLTSSPSSLTPVIYYKDQSRAYVGLAVPEGPVVYVPNPIGKASKDQTQHLLRVAANSIAGIRELSTAVDCGDIDRDRADYVLTMNAMLAKASVLRLDQMGGNGKDTAYVTSIRATELPGQRTDTASALLHLPHHADQPTWLSEYLSTFTRAGGVYPLASTPVATQRSGELFVAFPSIAVTPDTTVNNYLLQLAFASLQQLSQGVRIDLRSTTEQLVQDQSLLRDSADEAIRRIARVRS